MNNTLNMDMPKFSYEGAFGSGIQQKKVPLYNQPSGLNFDQGRHQGYSLKQPAPIVQQPSHHAMPSYAPAPVSSYAPAPKPAYIPAPKPAYVPQQPPMMYQPRPAPIQHHAPPRQGDYTNGAMFFNLLD